MEITALCATVAVRRPAVRGGGGAMRRPVPEDAAVLQQLRGQQPQPGLRHPVPHHAIQLQLGQRKDPCLGWGTGGPLTAPPI